MDVNILSLKKIDQLDFFCEFPRNNFDGGGNRKESLLVKSKRS